MLGTALIALQLLNQTLVPPETWQPIHDRPRNRRQYGPRTHWSSSFYLERNDPANSNTMMKLQRRLIHQGNVALLRTMWRMDGDLFEELLRKVRPYITYRDTNWRKAVPADYRLSMGLKYIATGSTQKDLAIQYRVSPPVVCQTIKRVYKAICKVLADEYLSLPGTPEKWREIASVFWTRWNHPNCIGAIDGKHIVVWMPARSGARYFTYKGVYSIIMLAIVGPNYEFLWVDVGTEGRQGDSNIWEACEFKRLMDNGGLGLPPAAKLPGTNTYTQYHLVGDSAFRMTCRLMKPFGFMLKDLYYRVCDYRFGRARRVSENAFGILSQRFLIFHRKIHLAPKTCSRMVLACCALHNMLRKRVGEAYINATPDDCARIKNRELPDRYQGLTPLQMQNQGVDIPSNAVGQRDALANYFLSPEGAVPWQNEMAYSYFQPISTLSKKTM